MHPAETYRRRAERAERDFENARDPKAKRFAQVAAQRWRELAELAQRQETKGAPIPPHFRDASEAVHYAQAQGYLLYWKGTPAFTKRQRELGDRFVARVHAQGHDPRQFGATRRAREDERKRTALTGGGRYYSTLGKSGHCARHRSFQFTEWRLGQPAATSLSQSGSLVSAPRSKMRRGRR